MMCGAESSPLFALDHLLFWIGEWDAPIPEVGAVLSRLEIMDSPERVHLWMYTHGYGGASNGRKNLEALVSSFFPDEDTEVWATHNARNGSARVEMAGDSVATFRLMRTAREYAWWTRWEMRQVEVYYKLSKERKEKTW